MEIRQGTPPPFPQPAPPLHIEEPPADDDRLTPAPPTAPR